MFYSKVSEAHLQLKLLMKENSQWMITGRTTNIFLHQREHAVLTEVLYTTRSLGRHERGVLELYSWRGWAVSGFFLTCVGLLSFPSEFPFPKCFYVLRISYLKRSEDFLKSYGLCSRFMKLKK